MRPDALAHRRAPGRRPARSSRCDALRRSGRAVRGASVPGPTMPDYRLRVTLSGAAPSVEVDDPYRYGRVLTDFDLHLLGEGTHHRAFEKLGAHRITHRHDDRRALRRVGAQRRARERRRRLQRVGRARRTRCGCSRRRASGSCSSRICRTARSTSSRSGRRAAHLLKKSDPFGFAFEAAAADRLDRPRRLRLHVARRGVDVDAARAGGRG